MHFIVALTTLLCATSSVTAAPGSSQLKPAPVVQLAKRIEPRQAEVTPCHQTTYCYQKITSGNVNVDPATNKYCKSVDHYIENPPRHCNRKVSNVASVCSCLQAPTPTPQPPAPAPALVCNQKGNLKDGIESKYTIRNVNTLDDCLDMCRDKTDCLSGGVWESADGMQACDLFTQSAGDAFTVEDDDGEYVYGDAKCARNVPVS